MTADFHTHILPGVDDGSRSVEESLEMLERCKKMGLKYVVLTPHFYAESDRPERFLPRRERAFDLLSGAVEGRDLPALVPGAEVHFFHNMSASDILSHLTIGNSRYLLVEMPMGRWTEGMYRELERIRERQGLTPIIAHVDRYISPLAAHGIPRRLSEMPVLVQANTEFFFNKYTSPMAMRMLRKGQIHLLGSDCHNLKDRIPNMGGARKRIQEKLGTEALDRVAYFERRVLEGGRT